MPRETVSIVGTGRLGLISGFLSNSGGLLILKFTSWKRIPSSYMAAEVSSTLLNSKNTNFFSVFLLEPIIGFPASSTPPDFFKMSYKKSFSAFSLI
jgi:hypothetical protein